MSKVFPVIQQRPLHPTQNGCARIGKKELCGLLQLLHMDKELVAYTDEAGNTGNHLFDANQPFFWTGTVIARSNLNQTAEFYVSKCCQQLGVSELHGSELGLQQIERIAHGVEVFIRQHRIRFVFTRLEKEILCVTKFVDTTFDGGINQAVRPLHYLVRVFRLQIAHIAAELMNLEDRKEFWEAYSQGNCEKFCNVLERFRQKVRTHIRDARMRQVLTEAVDWAQHHPENLLGATATELDSPNTVAVGLLIQALHEEVGELGQRLTRFIHDESNQFALAIEATFASLRGFKAPPRNASALVSDWTEVDTFACPIEMASSRSTPGVQVADVVLWLVKRYVDQGFEGFTACSRLARVILSRSTNRHYTQVQLREEAQRLMAETMSAPVTTSELQRATQNLASLEQVQKQRMSEQVRESELPPSPKSHAREMRNISRELVRKGEKCFKQ